MSSRFHSVYLIEEKCRGCTNCIKKCPTEAIRVREGKARINADRCTDCGECIRTCDNHAKAALTDPIERAMEFRHSVAMPAPSFYSQFYSGVGDSGDTPDNVLGALVAIGFKSVFDVAEAADLMSYITRAYIEEHADGMPFISPACPAVVRLIQVRFPGLLERVIPVDPPARAAGRLARERISAELGIPPEEIGTFFITPCPAKMTWVRDLHTNGIRDITGAIAANVIYPEVRKHLADMPHRGKLTGATSYGIGWGMSGGENRAVAVENSLVVDGIHNVIGVLEEMELGKLPGIDFIEAQACVGGCVGGALMLRNPFLGRVAQERLVSLATPSAGVLERSSRTGAAPAEIHPAGEAALPGEAAEKPRKPHPLAARFEKDFYERYRRGDFSGLPLVPQPALKLDEDVTKAISKMERLEKVLESLPGLDCGSCGSPHCRALAEDIVQGLAVETDCVFKLREQVKVVAEELFHLAQKDPSAMGKKTET